MQPEVLNRLKQVSARKTLVLTHYGRKTGKPYKVTIWFVLHGDKVYLGTANVNRNWVRNVQKTPQVQFSIAGEKFDGTARFISDRVEHERVMAMVRRKYWVFWPILTLGRTLAALHLMHDHSGSFEVTVS